MNPCIKSNYEQSCQNILCSYTQSIEAVEDKSEVRSSASLIVPHGCKQSDFAHMSLDVRNLTLHASNKGTDRPAHPRSLISALAILILESIKLNKQHFDILASLSS